MFSYRGPGAPPPWFFLLGIAVIGVNMLVLYGWTRGRDPGYRQVAAWLTRRLFLFVSGPCLALFLGGVPGIEALSLSGFTTRPHLADYLLGTYAVVLLAWGCVWVFRGGGDQVLALHSYLVPFGVSSPTGVRWVWGGIAVLGVAMNIGVLVWRTIGVA